MSRGGTFAALIFALSLLVSLAMTAVSADEVVVGFGIGKLPFVLANRYNDHTEQRGIEIDIFREALADSGRTMRIRYLPNRRLAQLPQKGEIDAAAIIPAGLADIHYSDDFVHFQNFAVTHAAEGAHLARIDDLKGRKIAAWTDARQHLGSDFAQAVVDAALYHEIVDQRRQVQMLLSGRVDTLMIDWTIFSYGVNQMGREPEDFHRHAIVGDKSAYTAGFTDPTLRDDFNRGLTSLKASGAYQEIYRKFGIRLGSPK